MILIMITMMIILLMIMITINTTIMIMRMIMIMIKTHMSSDKFVASVIESCAKVARRPRLLLELS